MTNADEDAIRGIVAEMTAASSRGDAEAVARMHARDADFVTGRGERFTGTAEIERRLTKDHATWRAAAFHTTVVTAHVGMP